MDVDPMEYAETEDAEEAHDKEKRKSRLNTLVAITVALLATFMAICKVKDDNIVQAMQQAQADKIDQWSYYQARNIRAEIYQATADQMRLQAAAQPPAGRAAWEQLGAAYAKLADEQNSKKKGTQAAAEKAQNDYDSLNVHDDQFDLSDASLSLAIALLALTALTQKRWLFAIAMVPTFFGVLMGVSGLFGLHLHPTALTRLLS